MIVTCRSWHKLADHLGIQRAVSDRSLARRASARPTSGTVKPKAWKKGRMPQMHVLRTEPNDLADRHRVRGDIAVRQHDPFRLARRAGREDHREQVVRLESPSGQASVPAARRACHRRPRPPSALSRPWQLGKVFEIDQLGVKLAEIDLFHEPATGQHVTHAALPQAFVHDLGRDRVVQVHHGAARQATRRR